MSDDNGHSNGNGHADSRVTYAEVRRAARWLGVFTPELLAETLRVHHAVAERFIMALRWQGMAQDTGSLVQGEGGVPEPVYEVEPLPETRYNRQRSTPPEVVAVMQMFGGFELISPRGKPVRIRTERSMRKSMSTPGARQVHKNRERAFRRQQQAVADRREREQRKRQAALQHKRYDEVAAIDKESDS